MTRLGVARQPGHAAGDEADGGEARRPNRYRLVARPRAGVVAGRRRVGRRHVQEAGREEDGDGGAVCAGCVDERSVFSQHRDCAERTELFAGKHGHVDEQSTASVCVRLGLKSLAEQRKTGVSSLVRRGGLQVCHTTHSRPRKLGSKRTSKSDGRNDVADLDDDHAARSKTCPLQIDVGSCNACSMCALEASDIWGHTIKAMHFR